MMCIQSVKKCVASLVVVIAFIGSHTLNSLQAYPQQSCVDAAWGRYYMRCASLDSAFNAREAILVAKYNTDMDLCTYAMLAEMAVASAWAAAEGALCTGTFEAVQACLVLVAIAYGLVSAGITAALYVCNEQAWNDYFPSHSILYLDYVADYQDSYNLLSADLAACGGS